MININIEKAKEIKKDALRIEREPLLAELDVEIMKNIGNNEKIAEIEAQKQVLRDITNGVDELSTVEELKAYSITK